MRSLINTFEPHGLILPIVMLLASVSSTGCLMSGHRLLTDKPLGVGSIEQFGFHLPFGMMSGPLERGSWAVPLELLFSSSGADLEMSEVSAGVLFVTASSGEWLWFHGQAEGDRLFERRTAPRAFRWYTYAGGGMTRVWANSTDLTSEDSSLGVYANCGVFSNVWETGLMLGAEFRYTLGTSLRLGGERTNVDGPQLMVMGYFSL